LSKSIVSILIGAAVEEGAIKSIEDPIIKYLPYLSTSGFRNVTVKNLLQMSTGVNYSEDYRDPKSGAALIGAALLTGNPSLKTTRNQFSRQILLGSSFNIRRECSGIGKTLPRRIAGDQSIYEKLWRRSWR
jgi:CubicO group peptidase (beta-lactamase class C family)